jgi:hypothetical protein
MAAGLALALHLAILATFLLSRPALHVGAGEGDGVMDVSLAGVSRGTAGSKASARPAAKDPAPPKKPTPPAPANPIKPRSVLAIVSDILAIPLPEHAVTPTPLVATPSPELVQAMAQAGGAPGAACDIGGAVQTAMRADSGLHATILLISVKQRSAADAVMMWNGEWISPDVIGGPATLDVLRVAIRQIIAAAAPSCRDREIVGPTFMLVPDVDATMVMVFGNASWRWSDLLVDQGGLKMF